MAANLRLVGEKGTGTAIQKTLPEYLSTYSGSGAIWPADLIGGAVPNQGGGTAEIWRGIAEAMAQSERVKSLSRTMAVFSSCTSKWKDETRYNSSMTAILLHPAYQRIIGLGPDVVPFVLRDLADTGAHWSWALQALTGENPVPEDHEGRPRLMAQAWLEWGRNRELI